jgi:hypothetical protein
MLFKNPVRTSKRTPHFTITKINWLTLFKFKVTLAERSTATYDVITANHCSRDGVKVSQKSGDIPDIDVFL